MANTANKVKEPLVHITKRAVIPMWKSLLIRSVSIIIALIVCAFVIVLLTKHL